MLWHGILWGWDTSRVIALDLALKLPQSWRHSSPRLPAISSLEPTSSWSQGAFLLPDVWWQSDQVVGFFLFVLTIDMDNKTIPN